MTIVAYKAGVIAADTAVWMNHVLVGDTVKIGRRADGSLIGGAGCMANVEKARKIFVEGGTIDDLMPVDNEQVELIVMSPDGQVTTFVDEISYTMRSNMEAVGIGFEIAMGAMLAGASAEQAVAITIKNVAGCGGSVVSYRHDDEVMTRRSVSDTLLGTPW